jgi:hypothetical protein
MTDNTAISPKPQQEILDLIEECFHSIVRMRLLADRLGKINDRKAAAELETIAENLLGSVHFASMVVEGGDNGIR